MKIHNFTKNLNFLFHNSIYFIIIAIIITSITIYHVFHSLNVNKQTFINIEEVYYPEGTSFLPITKDPKFKYGLSYWGISTPSGGGHPIYLNGLWITHSNDEVGNFSYSSIIQGCKPYDWGSGTYIFQPIRALEKMYLSVSLIKETKSIYRKDGFAGALVDLWFINFKGDALVIDLYIARDSLNESGEIKSVGKGFMLMLNYQNKYGKSYHFNYVLTNVSNGQLISLKKLSLEPILDAAFKAFSLNRSEWWLVSVDAGAEAHFSEIIVYLYELEIGKVKESEI